MNHKKILSLFLTVAMVLTLLVAVPVTATADTYNASDNPVIITTDADMAAFQSAVNNGTTFEGKTVKLAGDVALNGTLGATSSKPFSGNFDGQGHTVTITQSISDGDGSGGLFSFIRVPANSTCTVQNVKVTGSITFTGTNVYCGGGVISCVDAGESGSGGTLNITNVWSAVNVTSKVTGISDRVAGIVAFTRHSGSLKPITINMDSCVYSGTLTTSGTAKACSAFFGSTGNDNITGRDVTVNITNSLFAGNITFAYNANNTNSGIFVGLANAENGKGAVAVNMQNCISCGTVTFDSGSWSSMSNRAKFGVAIGQLASASNKGTATITNFYYKQTVFYDTTNLPLVGTASGTVTKTNADNALTLDQIKALTASDVTMTDTGMWDFGGSNELPIPASILATFPTISRGSCFDDLSADEFTIMNDFDMATFQSLVNGGNSFSGKTIKLGADVALNDTLGVTSSKPFMGNFDGQGHTVTITQSLTSPDAVGGLFSFVRTPASGEVTIQNVHVTGTISITNSKANNGWVGGVISAMDGNTSGTGGTINVKNIWSSVHIDCLGTECYQGIGGILGVTRHADNLPPLTINMDSCLWDGVINAGPALYYGGGLMAYTGNNKAGRTLTINITNCVAAGTIMTNSNWNVSNGVIFGYAKGSNSEDASAKVTLNISDVISCGKITNSTDYGASANIGHVGLIDGTTELNMTNVYFNAFDRGNLEGAAPALASGTANTTSNVATKTADEMAALTGSDFTNASKWAFKAAGTELAYIPCPATLAPAEGWITKLIVTKEMFITAEHRDTADDYAGIRFVGNFSKWTGAGNPGTQSATFGIIVILKSKYDDAAVNNTGAGLTAAGGLQVKAVKYREVDGRYTVSAVIYNIEGAGLTDATEIVAVPYIGETLGESITVSLNDVV